MFLEKQKNAFILYQGIRWPTNYCNMERDSPQRGGGIATASAAAAARGAATRGCAVAAAAPRREAEPFAPDDEEFLMVPSFPPARATSPERCTGGPAEGGEQRRWVGGAEAGPTERLGAPRTTEGLVGQGRASASGRSIAPPTQRQGCAILDRAARRARTRAGGAAKCG